MIVLLSLLACSGPSLASAAAAHSPPGTPSRFSPGQAAPVQAVPVPAGAATTDELASLRARFGFAGFEVYELGAAFDLTAGDLDGDGCADLGAVNNARSRIDLLLRLDAGAPDELWAGARDDDPNPIEYDGRYRHSRHTVERRVLQLAFGDVDGDGRQELVYVEQGGHLSVVDVGPDGEPGSGPLGARTRRVEELRGGCNELFTVDLDGTGRDTVFAVGVGHLLAFEFGDEPLAPGSLPPPVVVDHLDARVDEVFVADFDGDGLLDLLYVHTMSDNPLRLRRGAAPGSATSFGPRVDFDLPQIRSAAVEDIDGDGRAEVLVVQRLSGRLTAYRLEASAEDSALLRTSLPAGARDSDAPPTFALGDLSGDGIADLVVASPSAAELTLYLGRADDRPLEPRSFPSFVGVTHPAIADVDGDGTHELLVISGPERMLGIAKLTADGDLPFPQGLPAPAEPVALAAGDLDGDGYDDAVAVLNQGEGRSRETLLAVWSGSAAGLVDEPLIEPLPMVKKTPSAVQLADLDRDGRLDVLLTMPGDGAAPVLLFRTENGLAADQRGEDAPGLGVLAGAKAAGLAWVDVDGDGQPELLAAAAHFARALVFETEVDAAGALRMTPIVLEQFNAPETDAQIVACAALDLDGDGQVEIVLHHHQTAELLVFDRDAGGVVERIPAGGLDFLGFAVADLDGDHSDDLIVLGRRQFGVLRASREHLRFSEWQSYESPANPVFLDDLVVGDLDHDGRADIAIAETNRHALEIVALEDGALKRALGFKIFEQSALSGQGNTGEPRELVCADLTGDGKHDLALLVHDKLVLYVQE